MTVIGTVESLWRYPVKSMGGEVLDECYLGFAGVYGDRLHAFRSEEAIPGFPWLTGREQRRMVLYRPRFRHPEQAARPPNLAEAESEAPGLTPVYADREGMAVDVETPDGDILAVDDPALAERLNESIGRRHTLTALRSDRALTDCRPLSLCSLQTVARLSEETGRPVDKRRFRANVYLDLSGGEAFAEDGFVGGRLRIGDKVVVAVLERDPRCAMVTLDPDTAERDPAILSRIAGAHDGYTGVYAAALAEGVFRVGDPVELLD